MVIARHLGRFEDATRDGLMFFFTSTGLRR